MINKEMTLNHHRSLDMVANEGDAVSIEFFLVGHQLLAIRHVGMFTFFEIRTFH